MRAEVLGDPGAAGDPADDPGGAVPVQPPSAFGEEERSLGALAGGQVDGAGGARGDVRSRIIDVAAQLLRDEGPTAVTTRGVAQQAGVQAPMIYRLFGDKGGMLEAVAEHVMAAYVAAKAEIAEAASAAGTDPLTDLRAAWRAQIDFGVGNPSLFRLLSDPDRRSLSGPWHHDSMR